MSGSDYDQHTTKQIGAVPSSNHGQGIYVRRLPDSNCQHGDLLTLSRLLQNECRSSASMVIIDSNFVRSKEDFLHVAEQLLPYCTSDTRFLFLPDESGQISGDKASMQSAISMLFPSMDLQVQQLYWTRQADNLAGRLSFSALSDQVVPFLMAAPAKFPVACGTRRDGSRTCPAIINNIPTLRETRGASQIMNISASGMCISPVFVAEMIKRFCPDEIQKGCVIAPFDKYGILGAGVAMTGRKFYGLFPMTMDDLPGAYEATCSYIRNLGGESAAGAPKEVQMHTMPAGAYQIMGPAAGQI